MLVVKTSADVSALLTVESRFHTAIPSAKPAAIAAPKAVVSGIDGRTNTVTHQKRFQSIINITPFQKSFGGTYA